MYETIISYPVCTHVESTQEEQSHNHLAQQHAHAYRHRDDAKYSRTITEMPWIDMQSILIICDHGIIRYSTGLESSTGLDTSVTQVL